VDDNQRRAEPRGGRPQGDNPTTGAAVPRVTQHGRALPPSARVYAPPAQVYVPRTRVYNYNYYRYNYPRYGYPYRYGAYGSYPYGYSGFGLGYFYYDPYVWRQPYYSGYYAGAPYYGSTYAFDVGELRLGVSPRDAQVFVDGYYAGIVDDFDGTFQALKLESGTYHIEIVAPGYETLAFDIRINAGQKIKYRGELLRLRP
jgi:hypothetical protein